MKPKSLIQAKIHKALEQASAAIKQRKKDEEDKFWFRGKYDPSIKYEFPISKLKSQK